MSDLDPSKEKTLGWVCARTETHPSFLHKDASPYPSSSMVTASVKPSLILPPSPYKVGCSQALWGSPPRPLTIGCKYCVWTLEGRALC